MRKAGPAYSRRRDRATRGRERGERGLVRYFGSHRLDSLKRGDLVTVALQGELGKPRPALVVRSDRYADLIAVTILPITSTLMDTPGVRITVEPEAENGLTVRSQIMVDKPQTPPLTKIGSVIGALDRQTMRAVDRAMLLYLGLG